MNLFDITLAHFSLLVEWCIRIFNDRVPLFIKGLLKIAFSKLEYVEFYASKTTASVNIICVHIRIDIFRQLKFYKNRTKNGNF